MKLLSMLVTLLLVSPLSLAECAKTKHRTLVVSDELVLEIAQSDPYVALVLAQMKQVSAAAELDGMASVITATVSEETVSDVLNGHTPPRAEALAQGQTVEVWSRLLEGSENHIKVRLEGFSINVADRVRTPTGPVIDVLATLNRIDTGNGINLRVYGVEEFDSSPDLLSVAALGAH